MNIPKVSVVVPVCNAGKYLRKCASSLMAQTLRDIEVVFVDDGSTDGSSAVLDELAASDSRVRVIRQEHAGAARARNRGMDEVSGEYLYFCDADDWLAANMFEAMVAAAEAVSADVTVAHIHHYDEDTRQTYQVWTPSSEIKFPCRAQDLGDKAFSSFQWAVWNKLFRRSFIVANQLRFQDIVRTNDVAFVNAAVALAGKIASAHTCYYYRHNHGGNLGELRDRFPFAVFDAWRELREILVARNSFAPLASAFTRAVVTAVSNLERHIAKQDVLESVHREVAARMAGLGVDANAMNAFDREDPVRAVFEALVDPSCFAHLKLIQERAYGELVKVKGAFLAARKSHMAERKQREQQEKVSSGEIEALKAKVDEFSGKVKDLTGKVGKLKNDVKSRADAVSAAVAARQQEQGRREELMRECETLRSDYQKADGSARELARKLALSEGRNEELRRENGSLAGEVGRLTSEVKSKEVALARLEVEKLHLADQLAEVEAERDRLSIRPASVRECISFIVHPSKFSEPD